MQKGRWGRNSAKFGGIVSELDQGEGEEHGGKGGDTERSTATGNCYYIAKLSCFSYTDLQITPSLL